MKYSDSAVSLSLCLSVLLAVSLACGGDSATTNSSTPTTTNTASNQTKADTTTPKKIDGSYKATGKNPDGQGSYEADLIVTPRDDVYQFSWTSGGKSYDGVGVVTDNRVAVSYTDGTNGKGCGVVLYKINSDGSLDGKSGYWGVNSAETEKATPTSGTDLEGKYDITGSNPEGKDYTGTLDVKKDGEGYSFKWTAGSTFDGFGIRTGDKVAVGFGGRQCAFVSYEVKPDGTLEGSWGGPGAKTFGTERATKK